jgi:hypothetical protein
MCTPHPSYLDLDALLEQALCRVPETVGKDLETVGKGFADGRTRHRTPGKFFLGQGSLPRA